MSIELESTPTPGLRFILGGKVEVEPIGSVEYWATHACENCGKVDGAYCFKMGRTKRQIFVCAECESDFIKAYAQLYDKVKRELEEERTEDRRPQS